MGSRIRNDPSHVFEFFCEIGIPENSTQAPWIVWKFPHNFKDEEILKSLPEFAYPCEFNNNAVHHFSFVFTNIDSKWTFGFCRHAPNSPTCFVILSSLPWHETFYKVLNHAAELSVKEKTSQDTEMQLFLETMYKVQVPDPGLELHVNYGTNEKFVAVCPDHQKLPSIPENRNMTEYFNAVDAHNMMVIFASMLHERRILMTSKKLSRLSSCVQAANALIYPMHWQHIFIPVLPKHLLDYLSAPMPFLIGVPSSTFSRIKSCDLGDIVILDADNNKVETPFADIDTLPSEVLQSLRHDLKHPHEMLGDCVARAFLKALVKLIGGYWNALKLKPGEKITFSKEMFLQTRPSPMQPFLEKILDLQIFQQFIESRLKRLNSGQGVSDEFEFELTVQEDKTSSRLRNQYRDWVANMKKEGGAFFKHVRTKVKVTSKKAYKDIRSRIHEIHHNRLGIEDSVNNFRKRGGSVPTIYVSDAREVNKKCLNDENGNTDTLEDSKIRECDRHLQVTTDLTCKNHEKSSLDSPRLTFQPIDVDLMGDLHELIYRRCSLCSDKVHQRTSISDPQLIDLIGEEQNKLALHDHCIQDLTGTEETSVYTPPPLLPRPPITKTRLSSKLSSGSVMLSSERPLILLDGEAASDGDIKNDTGFVPYECNDAAVKIRNSTKSCITQQMKILSKSSCKDSVFIQSPSGKVQRSKEATSILNFNSSNPFVQNSENMENCVSPLVKSSSGPNVRNMISMWQSLVPEAKNSCLSSSTEKLKSDIFAVPFRSQPLSRTLSTPPSVPSVAQFSSSNSNNPFLSLNCESRAIREENTKFTIASSSWESFH